jgi:hypothetical protein
VRHYVSSRNESRPARYHGAGPLLCGLNDTKSTWVESGDPVFFPHKVFNNAALIFLQRVDYDIMASLLVGTSRAESVLNLAIYRVQSADKGDPVAYD